MSKKQAQTSRPWAESGQQQCVCLGQSLVLLSCFNPNAFRRSRSSLVCQNSHHSLMSYSRLFHTPSWSLPALEIGIPAKMPQKNNDSAIPFSTIQSTIVGFPTVVYLLPNHSSIYSVLLHSLFFFFLQSFSFLKPQIKCHRLFPPLNPAECISPSSGLPLPAEPIHSWRVFSASCSLAIFHMSQP